MRFFLLCLVVLTGCGVEHSKPKTCDVTEYCGSTLPEEEYVNLLPKDWSYCVVFKDFNYCSKDMNDPEYRFWTMMLYNNKVKLTNI